MSKIHRPPTEYVSVPNHPDLPGQHDNEDIVDYIGRVADWLTNTPPAAPEGFRLVPCEATPRHCPLYEVAEDVFYDRPCPDCVASDAYRRERESRCKLDHRRWKSWRIWWRISSRLYTFGVTSSGGGVSYGRCEFCGIGRQHMAPRWRGKRPYILGVKRETWACLIKRHHRRVEHYPTGLCAICCPCPECGSTDREHYTCEATR